MTYSEVLAYLYAQLPMFQRQGKVAFKKDLSNTLALCGVLGQPQTQFRSIHIAGTNGKGSVSHMLAAALQANGLKVGLYTSPHLKDYRERIRVNGKMVTKRRVTDFVKQYQKDFETIKPSFFEWSVALAFHTFAKENVDIAVIETGMGGRLDSTNVVSPLLSVITNIGYDHMEFLGDTLEKIAGEKAGIIKPGVPVIIGRTQKETKRIFISKAKETNSPLVFADQEKAIKLKTDLKGGYQKENVQTAYSALAYLKTRELLSIHLQKAKQGLRNVATLTGMKGRWQRLSEKPKVICDVGHNEEGVKWVKENLKNEKYNHLHFVWGMVSDKDHSKILSMLPKEASYYFCKPDIPRGLEANLLHAKALAAKLKGKSYTSVSNALAAAKKRASSKDLIFVGGSTFVVAEVV